MNKEYVNKIVFNEYGIYYVVKSFDNDTLRIEQLKKPYNDYEYAINLQQIKAANKRLSIIYYGYGVYDDKSN